MVNTTMYSDIFFSANFKKVTFFVISAFIINVWTKRSRKISATKKCYLKKNMYIFKSNHLVTTGKMVTMCGILNIKEYKLSFICHKKLSPIWTINPPLGWYYILKIKNCLAASWFPVDTVCCVYLAGLM